MNKSLELPCGLEGENGQVIRDAEIRKIKGRVRRDVARLASKKNPDNAAILEAILKPTLVSIGGQKITTVKLLKMQLADRDFVLFEAYRHTHGDH